ncbi:MAG: hypothetical protein V3T23_12570 [Nitrososphaerales archaeon]
MAMKKIRQVREVVRARRFEVLDGKGRVLGELNADDETPTLWLNDPDHLGSLLLAIMPGGFPELRFFCRGKTVAVLHTCYGKATLALANEDWEVVEVA